jgi:polysaccharide biosynthesis protein PslG
MSRFVRASRIVALGAILVALIGILALPRKSFVGTAGPNEAAPIEIGMSVRLAGADAATVSREFDLMAAMHVTWVRSDFAWSAIEAERGTFDWSYPDQIVNEAAARGMHVIAVLDYTPTWARPPGTASHTPPDQPAHYAEFARAAAARYAPRGVRSWEIWNEPNISDFWQPVPDANRYGELFRAAAAAVRGVDPDATLLTGGLTRGTDTSDGGRISQITYIQQLYRNGTAQLASAIAVHPYSFPGLPTGSNSVVGGFHDLPELHNLMNSLGDGGKKIWITEFGAPTGTDPEAGSEIDQLNAIVLARQQAQAWNWVGPLIYFEMRDGGTDPADVDQNFGVVRRDFSLKPAGKMLMS